MRAPKLVMMTGAAAWSSYLVNGEESGLDPAEKALADAWQVNNGVRVIDVERDDDGDAVDARFSWSYGQITGDDCSGGSLLDYVCEPLNPEEWSESSFI